MHMTTNCSHDRQARLPETDLWACQDCGALMDTNDPNRTELSTDDDGNLR
jgi:ribosomal protein L37AE/L43A